MGIERRAIKALNVRDEEKDYESRPTRKWKELTLVSNIALCPLRPAECPILLQTSAPFWAMRSLRTSKDMLQANAEFESSNCVPHKLLLSEGITSRYGKIRGNAMDSSASRGCNVLIIRHHATPNMHDIY
jgi:hypothetical protein